jgi:hypothetical protein
MGLSIPQDPGLRDKDAQVSGHLWSCIMGNTNLIILLLPGLEKDLRRYTWFVGGNMTIEDK